MGACVVSFCFRSTTVVLALVAINGALRTHSGNGAASTLGDLVGLTPGDTMVLGSNRRGAIPVSAMRGSSVFLMHPNRDVPTSNIVVRNRDTMSRSTLANRDVPMSGTTKSGISTTAIGQSKFLGYHTVRMNRSAALSRVVGVIDSTTTAGTPVTGVTSGISNVFIPTMVVVTMVAAMV